MQPTDHRQHTGTDRTTLFNKISAAPGSFHAGGDQSGLLTDVIGTWLTASLPVVSSIKVNFLVRC